jgi:hypothetical protein
VRLTRYCEVDPTESQGMRDKFASYAPHFTRPLTPEESVTAMLKVVEESNVNRDGGKVIHIWETSNGCRY